MASEHGKALVIRFESGDTVVERASNYCSSTLNLAHSLMHSLPDEAEWTITITAKELTSEQYDAIRAKFVEDSVGDLLALQLTEALKDAHPEGEGES